MREWITGRNPVAEVINARRRQLFRLRVAQGTDEKSRLGEIFQSAKSRKLVVEMVNRHTLDQIDIHHQGIALECSGYPYSTLPDILEKARQSSDPPFFLLLDMLQNPQNLGTLLRTAEAAGVHGVIIPLRRAAGVTPAVVNASSGASEHLLIAQQNLAQAMDTLKNEGVWLVGLEGSSAAQSLSKAPLDAPLGLVVGNEGEGMRLLIRQKCDFIAGLPLRGKIESLNAAVAGSIAIYQALTARGLR